jgi:hypothetical protein
MKKIIPFLIALFLFSCAPKNIQQLSWKNVNETSTKIPKYYNSESKIAYEVSNDNNHLYLKMLIGDKATKKQIMISGMSVWIDTTKKYSENFGLFYPLKGKKPPTMDKEKSGQLQPKKEKRGLLKSQFKSINLNGYKDGLHSMDTEKDLTLHLDIDENGYLIYNAKIPLRCFHITSLTEVDSTDLFSLNILIPGVTLPSGQDGPPQGGGHGGPPGGGGGQTGTRPNGGPGGSGRPGGQSEMAAMTNDKEIKVRFKLNLKK